MLSIQIDVDGTLTELQLGDSDGAQLATLKTAVGGWVEALPIPADPPLIMWANEDGHRLGLPVNEAACLIAERTGQTILGTVVVTGPADGAGGFTRIPEVWRAFFTMASIYREEK